MQALHGLRAAGMKNLKDLDGFRLTLKKKSAEHIYFLGKSVLEEALRQVLWKYMDLGSRDFASQSGPDRVKDEGYKKLYEDIDRR